MMAVRCESKLVSRHVFNRDAVRRYRNERIPLDPAAAEVARELAGSGVAVTTVTSLVDEAEFRGVVDYSATLREIGTVQPDAAKPYLTELLGVSPEIAPTNPLLQFALSPQIRGVAESYSLMKLKIQDVNVWVNQPQNGGSASQSQRWHRDLPEDYDIVKCFVYLHDVPEGAGPLQYVKRSNTPTGRKMRFDTEFDGIGYRLDDKDVAQAFAEEDIVQASGPAGTVVFADTRGIHRGGLAVDAERVVLQITYASDACLRPRNLRPAPGVRPTELPGVKLAGV
jgi:hypothetical protein